jgi:hypothetical protein
VVADLRNACGYPIAEPERRPRQDDRQSKEPVDSETYCREMNLSTLSRACSSVYCVGGDFMK